MNLWSALWQRYRRDWIGLLARAGIGLVLGASLFYAAIQWRDLERQQLANAQAALQDVLTRLGSAQRLLGEVQRHYDEYRAIEGQGFLAAPQPLEWLEALLSHFRDSRLPTLRFELLPAASASLPDSARRLSALLDAPPPLAVGFQELRFKLIELHEDEWLRFTEALERHTPGALRLEACHARRGSALGLDLDCRARWWFYPPLPTPPEAAR